MANEGNTSSPETVRAPLRPAQPNVSIEPLLAEPWILFQKVNRVFASRPNVKTRLGGKDGNIKLAV